MRTYILMLVVALAGAAFVDVAFATASFTAGQGAFTPGVDQAPRTKGKHKRAAFDPTKGLKVTAYRAEGNSCRDLEKFSGKMQTLTDGLKIPIWVRKSDNSAYKYALFGDVRTVGKGEKKHKIYPKVTIKKVQYKGKPMLEVIAKLNTGKRCVKAPCDNISVSRDYCRLDVCPRVLVNRDASAVRVMCSNTGLNTPGININKSTGTLPPYVQSPPRIPYNKHNTVGNINNKSTGGLLNSMMSRLRGVLGGGNGGSSHSGGRRVSDANVMRNAATRDARALRQAQMRDAEALRRAQQRDRDIIARLTQQSAERLAQRAQRTTQQPQVISYGTQAQHTSTNNHAPQPIVRRSATTNATHTTKTPLEILRNIAAAKCVDRQPRVKVVVNPPATTSGKMVTLRWASVCTERCMLYAKEQGIEGAEQKLIQMGRLGVLRGVVYNDTEFTLKCRDFNDMPAGVSTTTVKVKQAYEK